MTEGSFRHHLLAETLMEIESYDTVYETRNKLVLMAIIDARNLGFEAGFAYDHLSGSDFDGFRIVAYIELPTGQVSWHMPEHPVLFDGHTTEEKYARCRAWSEPYLG